MRTKLYNWERICARFPINNDRLLLFTSRNPSFGAAQQLRCELTELCWGAYRRVYRGEVGAEDWLLKLCNVSENEKKSKLSLQSSSWILQSLFVTSHTKVNALCLQARVTSLLDLFYSESDRLQMSLTPTNSSRCKPHVTKSRKTLIYYSSIEWDWVNMMRGWVHGNVSVC